MTRKSPALKRRALVSVAASVAIVASSLAVVAPAAHAEVGEATTWVLMNGSTIVDEFGSNESVYITGAQSGGGLIPSSDFYVIPNRDWSTVPLDSSLEGLDVTNSDHIPNTYVGWQVVQEPLWFGTLRTGTYDVVVDRDQDGRLSDVDQIIGFDSAPGFTVEYNGTLSELAKAALKEDFGARWSNAALQAQKYALTVRILEIPGTLVPTATKAGIVVAKSREYNPIASGFLHLTDGVEFCVENDFTCGIEQFVPLSGKPGGGDVQKVADNLKLAADAIYADPPDFDYTEVVPYVAPTLADETKPDPVLGSLAKFTNRYAEAAAWAEALLHAVEKHDGAAIDGATASIRLQAAAVSEYSLGLASALAEARTAAAALSDAASSQGLEDGLEARIDAATTTRERVAQSGLTVEERAALSAQGFSDEQIELLVVDVLESSFDTSRLSTFLDPVAEDVAIANDALLELSYQALNEVDAIDAGLGVNQPPIAVADTATVASGGEVQILVGENDSDPEGGPLTYALETAAMHGTAQCADGICTYAPTGNYTGLDSFSYRVSDAEGLSTVGTVSVTVLEAGQLIATADQVTVAAGGTVTFDVLTNDLSAEANENLTISSFTSASRGTANCEVGGRTCTYSAESGSGAASFTYTVLSSDGTKTAVGEVLITVSDSLAPPILIFGQDEFVVEAGSTLDLTYFADAQGNAELTNWDWSFSDGRTSSDPGTSFVFDAEGQIDVALTVTDTLGAKTTAETRVSVVNAAPSLTFVGTQPARAALGVERSFSAQANDTGIDETLTTTWDFGDGTTAIGEQVSHAWTSPGEYQMSVAASDGRATSEVLTHTVEVVAGAQPPSLGLSQTSWSIPEGSTLDLAPQISDPDGELERVTWDFGDGTIADGIDQTHQYASEGSFAVSITVIDDTGLVSVATANVTVFNVAPVITGVTTSSPWPRVGEETTIRWVGHDPGGDALTVSWQFEGEETFDGEEAVRAWTEPGTHPVRVQVTDDAGASTTFETTVSVVRDHDGPILAFDTSPDLNCDVRYLGDASPSFYGATACATFVHVAGQSPEGETATIFGPWHIPAGPSVSGFTPVSQSKSGTGTRLDPLTIETVVMAGPSIEVTQRDTYVIGDNAYRTDTSVRNISEASFDVEIGYGADCYLQDNDNGYGSYDEQTGAVTCRAQDMATGGPGDRIEQFIPLTPDSSWTYGSYSGVWANMVTRGPLPNELSSAESPIDNGMGLEWAHTVTPNSEASVARLTNFSPLGLESVPASVRSPASAEAGSQVPIEVTFTNPNLLPVDFRSIRVSLPDGFSYVPGSSTGASLTDPVIEGNSLTWDTPSQLQGGAALTLRFEAVASTSAMEGTITASGWAELAPVLPASVDIRVIGEPVNAAPMARIADPGAVPEGSTITLDGSGSTDPEGDPLTFSWDLDADGVFDDGSDPAATLNLPVSGTYEVALRVTAGTTSHVAALKVTAGNVVPSVALGEEQVSPDGSFTAAGFFVDPGEDTWVATVDYGDGTAPQSLALSGKTFELDYKYAHAGEFIVTVSVRDEIGASVGQTSTTAAVAANLPPVLTGLVTTSTDEGTPVTLNVAASDPEGEPVTLTWSTTETASCTLTPAGETATLLCEDDATPVVTVVANDEGQTLVGGAGMTTASTVVNVANVAPAVGPVLRDGSPLTEIALGVSVELSVAITDPGADTHECEAKFNGEVLPGTTVGRNCTFKVPSNSAGTFDLEITVTDDDGGQGIATAEVTFAGAVAPTPTPSLTPTATPSATPSPTPTPSQTPTATATAIATATSIPTSTSSVEPSQSSSSEPSPPVSPLPETASAGPSAPASTPAPTANPDGLATTGQDVPAGLIWALLLSVLLGGVLIVGGTRKRRPAQEE